ncbi:GNAT family N-acetyltransferase [Paraburkholderia phymatum]|uniref:GCN5-related N-acetyltransferase n=1 Tax=Paraburkholderia phymatum (strain DSM 17167 / CIP 108236 / LMG 21445 / STM815) TaxID=391038 RepID=B2JUU7_PARP8|nr:GNAT family N-acetyltransferase [Paraburkholderia phymatum]ACC74725.1 GCN5-related N-acetyltransferase [Paraburkholderia phymatum STM815]
MEQAPSTARDLIVRTMNTNEVNLAIEWAAREGWNPGLHDASCFRCADPKGFFVGEWRGEAVGSISAIAYDGQFGFIGLYIVRPEFRGKGFGLRIWQHGIDYLGKRNIGLDGVVAQQPNYRKSGFELAYRNIRFQGIADADASRDEAMLVDARQLPFEQLASYDGRFFPAPRAAFLRAWIDQPGAVSLAHIGDGQIRGYGVLRRCREGRKIGPLFADDKHIAEALFTALVARCAGETVTLDVPELNSAAVALAERHRLTSVFETARMYTKRAPDHPLMRLYGVTTFELG